MERSSYLPKDEAGQSLWLNNLAQKLPLYATPLGVTAAVVTQVQNDAKNFAAMLGFLEALRQYSSQSTAYKNLLRQGNGGNTPIGTLATAPTLPVFTPAPPVGDIFGRLAKMVATIKNNANYTEAIGQDLGVIGSEANMRILIEIKPDLKVMLQGGHPNIIWKKGKMDAIKILVDRGSGTFEFLAVDTQPDYLDNHQLPPMGQAAVWKYLAIYLKADQETGDWSDVVEIAVAGRP